MDTQLTIEQILLGLRNSGIWNKRSDIMLPNLSWGLLPYEADFVVVSKSGYMSEVEIKRSFEDFKADFKKKHHHDAEQVYYFYYCVPEAIKDKVKDFMEQNYTGSYKPNLLVYDENGRIINTGYGVRYNKGKHRKLFLEEQLVVARLASLRYWNKVENKLI